MARGKHLSLEDARKRDELDQFAKEHPSSTSKARFERFLDAVCGGGQPTKKKPKAEKTSSRDDGAC